MVVSGVPRATVVLPRQPSKVARKARSLIGARAWRVLAGQVLMVRPRARHAMWGTNDPPGMCTLPIVHISVVPERLRSVNRRAIRN